MERSLWIRESIFEPAEVTKIQELYRIPFDKRVLRFGRAVALILNNFRNPYLTPYRGHEYLHTNEFGTLKTEPEL